MLPEDAGIGLTPASEVSAVSWTVAQYGIIGELSGGRCRGGEEVFC